MSPNVGAGLRQGLGAISGWVSRAPESMIATMTFEASLMTSHAATALMSAPTTLPASYPVLLKRQSDEKLGSLGVA
jgi:hypothetical protein